MIKLPEAVVVTYVFNKKGELLLVKNPKLKTDWVPMGGHIEYGEKILETAKREVMEETGLNVVPLGILYVSEGVFPKEFIKKVHYIYLAVVCRTITSKVILDKNEATEYGWFKPSRVLQVTKNKEVKAVMKKYFINKGLKKLSFVELQL
jgi:8-oxo-dGTP diphosphatase